MEREKNETSARQTLLMSVTAGVCVANIYYNQPLLKEMAAHMSPHNKGKIVGIIFMGILTGILAARVFSGFIAEWLSWRYGYGIGAAMVLATSLVLYRSLPDITAVFKGSYPDLLRSVFSRYFQLYWRRCLENWRIRKVLTVSVSWR